MVRTRQQATERVDIPTPSRVITRRKRKRVTRTQPVAEGVETPPSLSIQPPPAPYVTNVLTQQQVAQQLASLVQALTLQPTIPHNVLCNVGSTAPAGPGPPPSKHVPAPRLAAPEGMTIVQFRDWKRRWKDFATTQQIEKYALDAQHGILRSALDTEWTVLWNSSRLKINNDTPLPQIVDLLESYIRKKRNPLLDRQEFHRRDQMVGECVDRYYAALKELDDAGGHEDEVKCPNCIFGNCTCGAQPQLEKQMQDIRIRDRFIVGLRDKEMQRRILAEQYDVVLTIEKVLSICTAIENSYTTGVSLEHQTHHQNFYVNQHQEVYAASSYRRNFKPHYSGNNQRNFSRPGKCIWCGDKRHDRERCPARYEKCKNCGKLGHFDFTCLQRSKNANATNTHPSVNQELIESTTGKKLAQNVVVLKAGEAENSIPITTMIGDTVHLIKWLPDTGADVDAISYQDVSALGLTAVSKLTTETQEVFAANGSSLGPVGSLKADLRLNNKSYHTTIRVFKTLTTPLLSKNGCIALGLIDSKWPHSQITNSVPGIIQVISSGRKEIVSSTFPLKQAEEIKQSILQKLSLAFDDTTLRPMKGPPMKIDLVADAKPCKRYKAYSVPFHWQTQVKSQIEEMVAKGIIEPVPVGEPVDWCHPMVVVPKKGTAEPRITVDLTGLNPYVRRPVYPVKVPREVVAKIPPGMKYFTTLDARHGYWQVPLDEQSKKLTTFITPWGCFRFCRNVMGLISAGDEHNRRGDEAIKGIDHTDKIVEDIIIYDDNLEDHTKRVSSVIERCIEHGITLNKKKFNFAKPEVEWCGFTVSQGGYTPAPHLVQALLQFPTPVSKTDVRSFCGLVQQFESFSPNISSLALPIRALLQKNSAFMWDSVHEQAFRAVILELASPRVLAHFDPHRPVRLETDGAQSKGLGFALWQQQPNNTWKLLQAGSRFVTPIEARYSATEIELLAVVWAVKKCRLFLLGNPFELVVDHRPLTAIINCKTLDEIENPRIQRLKEKLSLFRPHAVWRAGKQHIIVDVFSRHPSSNPTIEDHMETDITANFAIFATDQEDGSRIRQDPIIKSVMESGSLCGEYQRLLTLIQNGFPNCKQKLDDDLKPYWKIKDYLTQESNLILWGSRILIPVCMRRRILEILHASHQGQERTLRRARQAVFWPNISNDIRNMVQTCEECATRLPSQQKEPLMSEDPPKYPFQCVGVDLFKQAGYEYLVMVDRYSGWLTVAKCGRSATTSIVIYHLKRWMMDLGIPEKLISDNGPQFTSLEFKNWTKKWGIDHDPSSPHYPQANGLAESAVKAASNLLAKTSPFGDINHEAFQLGLLELRNTPRADGRSPAQLLFGHPIRSQLPLHRSRFTTEWKTHAEEADRRAVRLREKAEQEYNATAKPMSRLKCGDVVRIQDPRTKTWNKIGQVIDVHSRGRSYIVRTESGRTYWRNRKFLRLFNPVGIVIQSGPTTTHSEEPNLEAPRRSSRCRRPPQRYGFAAQRDQRSHSEGGHEVFLSELPHSSQANKPPANG